MAVTERYYILSAESLKEKIQRIDNIIDALETQALDAAGTSTMDSYSFDDGQISVNVSYRSPAGISKSIQLYESLKQKYLNQLNGRNFVLRDWRGLS
jgi:hypothetical protein